MSCSAVSYIAPFKLFPSRLKSLDLVLFPAFSTSKPVCFHGILCKGTVPAEKRVLRRKTRDKFTRAAAFRRTDGDETFGFIENKTILTKESSDFLPDFMGAEMESTLNQLSKWLIVAGFGGVVLWRHDASALWAVMGSVVNSGLSVILKRIFNQERPVSNLKSDPGMPSSHAQSIFFAVIYTVLSLIEWLGLNGLTVAAGLIFLALGFYLSWLRVSLQFHTMSQVIVGAIIGSIFSILWFWLWVAIVMNAYNSFLWVRIVVILFSAGSCLTFLLFAIKNWFREEL